MAYMKRSAERLVFTFDSGETAANETFPIKDYSSAIFVFPSEFNGDTITVKTDIAGDTGFTLTAATGRVNLDTDQMAAFFPMGKMTLVTNTAVSADASVYVDLKS